MCIIVWDNCTSIKYITHAGKPLELPRNLQLADPTVRKSASLDVDILLGNDYYAVVITVKSIHENESERSDGHE